VILQTLDIENNCSGIFHKGKIIYKNLKKISEKHSVAWKHSTILDDSEYRYLYLHSKKRALFEFSPEPENFRLYHDYMSAQALAAATAKIDLEDMCIFDMFPERKLIKWLSLRESALQVLLDTTPCPSDYNILHKAHVLTTDMASRRINYRGDKNSRVLYDIFGSATGRLTTRRKSAPVLTLKKEERNALTPQNDLYLEIDLNGAEIRTLLALSGKGQPEYDIHEYNMTSAARGLTTRQEIKARFFAWLYNPEAKDYQLEKLYDKGVYKEYYEEGSVATPFGRKLLTDERKALSYLLQSTTSDIVLENAYKIMKFLGGKKSFVAFTMHDSVVLDFSREDYHLVRDLKEVFEENRLGRYHSRVCIGKNFGEMEELKL